MSLKFFRLSLFSLSALALSLPLLTMANCQFETGQSTYNLIVNGSHLGSITETNQAPQPGQYQMTAVTQAKIMFFKDTITETSSGLINSKTGVSPQTYQVDDTHSNKPVSVNFDSTQHQASLNNNGTVSSLPMVSNMQDNLSYKLALRWLLISGKTPGSMTVIAQDKNKNYKSLNFKFVSLGHQKIKTALGELDTVELSRQDPAGTTSHYWFAPSKNYLLVKTDAIKPNGQVEAEGDITAYTPAKGCLV